jgi:hypothetical protein
MTKDLTHNPDSDSLSSPKKMVSSRHRIHSDSSNDEIVTDSDQDAFNGIKDIHALAKYSDQDITEYDQALKEGKLISKYKIKLISLF